VRAPQYEAGRGLTAQLETRKRKLAVPIVLSARAATGASERTHSPNPLLGKNCQDAERLSANFVRQRDLDAVQGGVNRLPQVVMRVEIGELG